MTVAVVAGVMASGATAASAQSTDESDSPATTAPSASDLASFSQIMAVATATGGSFDGKRLTLTGVEPRLTWFSDRPQRQAGLLPAAKLDKVFFERQSPPNAALVLDGAPTAHDVVVVELSKPRYDAKARSLSFATKQIQADEIFTAVHPRLSQYATRADTKLPAKFDRAALFIDAAPFVKATPGQSAPWTADRERFAQLQQQQQTIALDAVQAINLLHTCMQNTGQQAFLDALSEMSAQYRAILAVQQELPALGQVVADGGLWTPAQQAQIDSISQTLNTAQIEVADALAYANAQNCQ